MKIEIFGLKCDACEYNLIQTAWGLEAGDELVVNANHN